MPYRYVPSKREGMVAYTMVIGGKGVHSRMPASVAAEIVRNADSVEDDGGTLSITADGKSLSFTTSDFEEVWYE